MSRRPRWNDEELFEFFLEKKQDQNESIDKVLKRMFPELEEKKDQVVEEDSDDILSTDLL